MIIDGGEMAARGVMITEDVSGVFGVSGEIKADFTESRLSTIHRGLKEINYNDKNSSDITLRKRCR